MEENPCQTCLSTGRMLSPLGSLGNLYRSLLEVSTMNTASVEVCWECRANLLSIKKFMKKARIANDYQIDINKLKNQSLSNITLNTVKYYNTEILYASSEKLDQLEDTKLEVSTEYEEDDTPINNHVEEAKTEENDIKSPLDKKETIFNTEEKHQKNNKWAKVKAIENKVPKFKLLKGSEIVMDVAFQKNKISLAEFRVCMEKEKACPLYQSSNNKCTNCLLLFIKKSALEKHNKKFHDEKKSNMYKCDICQSIFSHKRHLATHTEDHSFSYQCAVCEYTTCTKLNAKRHLKEKHRNIYQCLKCTLKYQSRREFYHHYKTMHENFVCDYCGVSFKLRYCIQNHIRKQHTPRPCALCGQVFARNSGLWLHTRLRHAPAPPQPAYCVECDKTFKNVYSYKWHLGNSARHNPRKKVSIPCTACEKVFTKKIYMMDHYNLVHLKVYKYRCEACDKNFIRNADLRTHTRRAHEHRAPRRDRPCGVCGRAFSNNKILKNHLRIHTGERPFACEICPSRFAQRAAMLTHRRNVHRDKYNAAKT